MLACSVTLSRSAFSHNISLYRKLLGEKTKFAGIVKSNAYGHGLLETAGVVIEAGADLLGVNSLEEAVLLRKSFPKPTIMIMGSVPDLRPRLQELADSNFWVLVSRVEEMELLSQLSPAPKIHFKLDTGMSRLGESYLHWKEIATEIKNKKLPLAGLATHFASTEDFTEHSYSMFQLNRFQEGIELFRSFGFKDLICHCASSASAMLFPEARMDMVRVGISMYGLWPSLETKLSLSQMGKEFGMLRPALTWKTKIQHIQSLPSGAFVGYGSTYKTTYPTRLAVIPVGYYEGLDRKLSNHGYMLVHGERAKILGRICMNMTMIEITHIPDAKLNDEVIIIGRSGKEIITADDHALWTNTINYEVVTKILDRFPRTIVD
ncbi:alanine racemase [Leptospira ilyithenensis]|uniref:Alanine racemase n=1 Tax=Leptospira ilyithenensis TaxID=2484901 RepID=A0A4R9LT53_9LEPT|nr:alanine racemase [Leptospira ilyithenensis]TGN14653.1 alanine racemase [Leptospira ilyithenensis]